MKILKPQKLSLLTRPFERNRKFYLGVSVMAFIPLRDEPALLPEVALWPFVAEQLGSDAAIDTGMPKHYGEFVVTGDACMPGGQPDKALAVRVMLAGREKTLFVFGDREWDGRVMTDPQPFVRLPIDWKHAYGGPAFADNPLGIGHQPEEIDGRRRHRLPNVEHPASQLRSPGQKSLPAGFGAVDIASPRRMALAGTHDDGWLKDSFPGFARDIDWRFFNLADPDQHFDKPLHGDEAYQLQNLHPQRALIEGRLPGLRMRCFITRRGRKDVLEEIAVWLTTVWFFPNAERAVLIHHGSARVAEEDAADVENILIGAEWLDQERPVEHYRQVLEQRLDKRDGAIHSLRDADLMPPGVSAVDEELEAANRMVGGEGLLRSRVAAHLQSKLDESRSRIVAAGASAASLPALPTPPRVPSIDELPAFIEQQLAQSELHKAELLTRKARYELDIRGLYSRLGMSFDRVMRPLPGPPSFSASSHLSALRASVASGAQPAKDAVERMLGAHRLEAGMQEVESALRKNYVSTAHLRPPAPPALPERVSRLRDGMRRARELGRSLAGLNLTGADFRDQDLHDADLNGALLESVNLAGVDLKGADLSKAVLAHADLQGADLSGANLEGANLGAARLNGAKLCGANLKGAVLAKADLSGADFSGCLLETADLSGALMGGANFAGARAAGLFFNETSLAGVSLAGADLSRAVFIKCSLQQANLRASRLEAVNFCESDLSQADFSEAWMENARFVERCVLKHAVFRQATLARGNLRGCDLEGADFTQAGLNNADFSEAIARGASFAEASCRETQFVKAELQGACFVKANLHGASLQRASIHGADFSDGNLFATDFARVRTDPSTRFEGAYAARVRTLPKHVEQGGR